MRWPGCGRCLRGDESGGAPRSDRGVGAVLVVAFGQQVHRESRESARTGAEVFCIISLLKTFSGKCDLANHTASVGESQIPAEETGGSSHQATTRPSSRHHPPQTLLHPYRAGLRQLDQTLHLLSQRAPACRDGRATSSGLAHSLGCGWKCRRFNPEPGSQRVTLSLQRDTSPGLGSN